MLLQRTQVLYLSPIWHQSTPYNFNPKEFSILFCTLEALGIYMTHTGTCRQSTHTHRILLQKIIQMIFKDMKIYKYKCTFSFLEWSSREHLYLLKKNHSTDKNILAFCFGFVLYSQVLNAKHKSDR